MKHKNLTALLLLSLLLISTSVSCGGSASGEKTTEPEENRSAAQDTTAADADSQAEADERAEFAALAPAVEDLEQYEYRFVTDTADINGVPLYWVEKENGELMNDALYRRNRAIEEAYNVRITQNLVADVNNTVSDSVLAGDDFADLICESAVGNLFRHIKEGYLYDLYSMPELHFEAPWWNERLNTAEIYGKLYLMVGDISIGDELNQIVVTYNKKLYEDAGYDNPYTIVKEGKWTMDRMHEMAKGVTRDMNGDSKITLADTVGMITEINAAWQFFVASGQNTYAFDGEDYVLTIGGEKFYEFFDHVFEFLLDSENVFPINNGKYLNQLTTGGEFTEADKLMQENRLLFRTGTFRDTQNLRDMETDFGILPMPKSSEEQTEYYCQIGTGCIPMSIPVTVTDTHKTALLTEALAYESKYAVVPSFYELYLGEKILRDTESFEMMQLVFSSKVINIDGWFDFTGMSATLRNMVSSGKNNLASKAASIEKSAQKKLTDNFGAIRELD